MVTVGLEQALRRRVPVDSPYNWDRDTSRPVPAQVDPEDTDDE